MVYCNNKNNWFKVIYVFLIDRVCSLHMMMRPLTPTSTVVNLSRVRAVLLLIQAMAMSPQTYIPVVVS